MTQNDHSDVYIIPPNFVRDGTLFSGRAEARNVVEAAFLALVGIRFLVFLNLGIKVVRILSLAVLTKDTIPNITGQGVSGYARLFSSYRRATAAAWVRRQVRRSGGSSTSSSGPNDNK